VATARQPKGKTSQRTTALLEFHKCKRSFAYFADKFCNILADGGGGPGDWVRFALWPEQFRVAKLLQAERLIVMLKARQLGLTWLLLAFALWLMLFYPVATILLFSRRDDEAVDLLKTRLRGIYDRLPQWLKVRGFKVDNDHEWELSTGSRVLAFPTTAGDSYTATLAVVDEADLVPDLDTLMRAVKPTIDAGGRMVLLSRADKSKPESPFKRIYRAAKNKSTAWVPVFLPWFARPGRDVTWYEQQAADVLHRTGSLDDLHEQYPASDIQALAPRTLDKRLSSAWIEQCYVEQVPLLDKAHIGCPAIPNLIVYVPPTPRRRYVIGADPAEGNPTSDESAASVLDADSREEVASLAGIFQPEVFAGHLDAVGMWYNRASLLVERNNHGHAVLLWLKDHSRLTRLSGHDGNVGWLSSTKGKALLYDRCAKAFREKETLLHSFATLQQLQSIEGSSLRAPESQPDDRAMGYALAIVGTDKARPPHRIGPMGMGGNFSSFLNNRQLEGPGGGVGTGMYPEW